MAEQKNRVRLTIAVLLAFAALITGLFFSQQLHKKKTVDVSKFNGTLLEKPRKLQAFSLVGIDDLSFNNQSLEGHWTMVFFGFTRCGYLCPTTMAELGKMYKLLEQKGIKPLPRVLMVSIDPERDNPAILKKYVKTFDRSFYAARGEDAVVKKMTSELGVAYLKVAATKQDPENKDYDIQHSGTVMLINPQGELNAFFTMPHQAELLAQDYALLAAGHQE